MSSKINKLELNIKDSSNQSLETPESSKREKNEKDKDNEFDNLIFDRSKEQDEEIKNLQKIYNEKLKEIEKLTNEIKLKDDEISLMNNAKNKFITSGEKKESDFEKSNLTEEELKAELLKLGQEYNDEVQKCTKLHEEKIKSMKDEINQLKNQINNYYNKNEYISKEEHDKILMDLRKKHEQELEPFKKELSDLEKFLADNFPNLKNNSNI